MKSPFAILLIALSIGLTSCSKDDDNSNNNSDNQAANQLAEQVESTVTGSSWIITKFIDSGDTETNHFNNYSFSFNSDGSLVATDGTNTVNGSWSVTVDSSSSSSDDDSSSSDDDNDVDFNIVFISPADFEELSDDWDIISNTDTKIELIDVSGGNGGTDYLTFEKN